MLQQFLLLFFHKFNILSLSPLPLFVSLFTWNFFLSTLLLFFKKKIFFLLINLFTLLFFMLVWWRDIIYESMMGYHNFEVKNNLKMGMMLFIFSEVMFFLGWFWAFFHNSLTPSNEIGSIWPPFMVTSVEPFQIPFLNTCILLSSGVTVTWAHHLLLTNKDSFNFFILTIALGLFFTYVQAFEYMFSSFSMSESSFGSSFFVTTGFHGLHVLVGSNFLLYVSYLILFKQMNKWNNLSVEFAIWYWHFVDVVWLFLFFFMYWWSY